MPSEDFVNGIILNNKVCNVVVYCIDSKCMCVVEVPMIVMYCINSKCMYDVEVPMITKKCGSISYHLVMKRI